MQAVVGHYKRLSFILCTAVLLILKVQILFSQTIKDFDGNIYRVIQEGHYVWMAENLHVTHDSQGNPLDFFTIENPFMDSLHYGFLYSWSTAMDSSNSPGTQGICPDGWHLPTDEEWDSLTIWTGGIEISGAVLKREGENEFGALMCGNFNPIQQIQSFFGEQAYFWTSSSYSIHTAWMRHLGSTVRNINRSTVAKHYGFSVRCTRKVE